MARFARRRFTKRRATRRRAPIRRGRSFKTPRRRFAARRSVAPKTQFATAHQTREQVDVQSNTMYSNTTTLADFDRLVRIAENYREYRITKVEFRYESLYTMAQQGQSAITIDGTTYGPGAGVMPNRYWVMDRNGTSTYTNLGELQELGQKGSKFRGTQKIAYIPNIVLLAGLQQVGVSGSTISASVATPKKLQWLPTADPAPLDGSQPLVPHWSAVPHYGHQIWFDQDGAPAPITIGQLTVTCTVQFRGPRTSVQVM